MRKLFIFSHTLEPGGAERSLLGMLENIDYTRFQVDLFLMHHKGEMLRYLPKQVNLLPASEKYECLAVPISDVIKKHRLLIAAGRTYGRWRARRFVREHRIPPDNGVALLYSHKYTRAFMPGISAKEYDLAISFLTPHYFVAEKIHAKRKAAWVHTDYSEVGVDSAAELRMWSRYDIIAAISEAAKQSFINRFPELGAKVTVIGNMLPVKYIARMSNQKTDEPLPNPDGAVQVLSIGRFCYAKNFEQVPLICRLLRGHGINVRWYLIGFGPYREKIHAEIQREGMQEYVIDLGIKENPYPYIKLCDIYVQPSRFEGKCVSVIEAQALGKPVVIANYPTSGSQLRNNTDGIIGPGNPEGMAECLARLIRDPQKQRQLSSACLKSDYSNQTEIEKIYEMVSG